MLKEPVHILAFCRKPELLPAATLVFKTLRVGFPRGQLFVSVRNDSPCLVEITSAAREAAAAQVRLLSSARLGHDEWIRYLIETSEEPFWICDTDVIFWNRFRHEPDGSALAGVHMPSFCEPWTGTRYRERLHPCLMRIDPSAFKRSFRKYLDRFPPEPFHPLIEPVLQQWQPERLNGTVIHHFYDTLAMAWHAFGGQDFTEEQIESFSHLNCATYADLIGPSQDFDMLGAHKAVYENIENARGLWAKQFQWFAEHREKS
jgi:hypothetical protein